MGVFTIILAACAIANVVVIVFQLREMHSGGIDTHNLALAAHDQAVATGKLKDAGGAQAIALDKLRAAGEAQATAADKLRLAGESQAKATTALAENSGKQIDALLESTRAAVKSADATVTASKSTDRLANAGKAQADALNGQLDLVRQQVVEAKAQTAAIASQTTAIIASSDAAVKSAEAQTESSKAQQRSADAIAASNLPQITLVSLNMGGIGGKPDKDGNIAITLQPSYSNIGGGTLYPSITAIKLVWGSALPPRPDYSDAQTFGGNDLNILHGGSYSPTKPVELKVSAALAQPVFDGKVGVFVIGYATYFDVSRQQHRWCYAYLASFPKGGPQTLYWIGDDAYRCDK